jgi:DNA polymerase IV
MTIRKIIHIDLDAFFCAVEELHRPELTGKPFAVGGKPTERGVVSSCSYAARKCGVRSAMPMSRAIRLCPELIIVSSDFSAYRSASEQVMQILNDVTPLVEQVSIDEAFLDVSDLPETGEAIARRLQQEIRTRTSLPCSLGIASNKLVAKTATDTGKAKHREATYPNAILAVAVGEEAAFLAPLPAQALWGVGPKTAVRLAELGIKTIGDLAAAPEKMLVAQFGKMGHELRKHANGVDDSPVVTTHNVKSISQEITFDRDTADGEHLRQVIAGMASEVASRLRQEGLCAGTVRIKLRWPDFSTYTRQLSIEQPTDQDNVIMEAAIECFRKLWQPGKAVRLIGVGASNLTPCAHQMTLWDTPSEKERRILQALDGLRDRYGRSMVRRGMRSQRSGKDKHNSDPDKGSGSS